MEGLSREVLNAQGISERSGSNSSSSEISSMPKKKEVEKQSRD
jgi:hypothetical protein